MKAKRQAFDIAVRGGGRESVMGYVLGDWATRKERWFWEFTHLPTGLKISAGGASLERKAEALAYLERLNTEGPDAGTKALFAKYGSTQWALGMV